MSTQKRPLSGMVDPNTGAALPRAVGAVATLIHTLGNVPAQNGGPFIDDITLVLSNTTGAALVVDLLLGGLPLASISVPANGLVPVTVDLPFASPKDAPGATLTGQCAAPGVVFFGWFARPL